MLCNTTVIIPHKLAKSSLLTVIYDRFYFFIYKLQPFGLVLRKIYVLCVRVGFGFIIIKILLRVVKIPLRLNKFGLKMGVCQSRLISLQSVLISLPLDCHFGISRVDFFAVRVDFAAVRVDFFAIRVDFFAIHCHFDSRN